MASVLQKEASHGYSYIIRMRDVPKRRRHHRVWISPVCTYRNGHDQNTPEGGFGSQAQVHERMIWQFQDGISP